MDWLIDCIAWKGCIAMGTCVHGLIYIKALIDRLHHFSIYARERIDRLHWGGCIAMGTCVHELIDEYIWNDRSIALHQGHALIAMGKCVHGLIHYVFIYERLHWGACIAMDTCVLGFIITTHTIEFTCVHELIDSYMHVKGSIDCI